MTKVVIRQRGEIGSAVIHLVGIGLAVAALVVLILSAVHSAGARQVATVSIYGSTLILLYTASTLYHFFPPHLHIKGVLQKLDHTMIYLLIAGTYTPITLVGLGGGWGWSLFGINVGLAGLGIFSKWFWPKQMAWLHIVLYTVMGWLILLAIVPLLQRVSQAGLFWLGLGGIIYTGGIVFYSLGGVFAQRNHVLQYRMHEIFHLFVLAGSFSHFWFLLWYLHR